MSDAKEIKKAKAELKLAIAEARVAEIRARETLAAANERVAAVVDSYLSGDDPGQDLENAMKEQTAARLEHLRIQRRLIELKKPAADAAANVIDPQQKP